MRRRWPSFQRWFSSTGEFCSVEPEEGWTHFSISNVVSWNQTHELFSFFFFIFVFFAADGLQGRPQVIDAQERSHQPQGLHGLLLKDLGIFLLHLQEADPFSKLGGFFCSLCSMTFWPQPLVSLLTCIIWCATQFFIADPDKILHISLSVIPPW